MNIFKCKVNLQILKTSSTPWCQTLVGLEFVHIQQMLTQLFVRIDINRAIQLGAIQVDRVDFEKSQTIIIFNPLSFNCSGR